MSRVLSNALLAQLYGQESNDPFLILLTMTHDSFDTIRLVNNTVDIVSRTQTFLGYPFRIVLSPDDGEQSRNISLSIDNTSLELIDELRQVTTAIGVKLELILASDPNTVQIEIADLEIQNISYNKSTITATLVLDGFLNQEMIGERYIPTKYIGLF